METFWNDLRYAWRRLWRSPGFALVALTTLTLGIGATSSVTSVAGGILLQRLPYPSPERLVLLESFKSENGGHETFPSSWLDYLDWRTRTRSFDEIAIHSLALAFNLASEEEPERINGEIVTSTYFPLVGIKPLLGRVFSAADDRVKDAPRQVILGNGFWKRRFGGDRGILGRRLIVDGEAYEIIGVLPAGFKGLTDDAEIWLPATMSNDLLGNTRFLDRRGVRWFLAVGRLKPGVTAAQAQADMDAVSAALAKEFPDTNEGFAVEVKGLQQAWFGDLRFPLLALLGASLFVLLIAWTTVANLLLARAVARQREISVRVAVGATRGRLVRQLLTESLLLSLLSCTLGLLLAQLCTGVLVRASTLQLKSFIHLGLSPWLVSVIVLLSVACGLFFGLVPAWLGLRGGGYSALRENGTSHGIGRQRFQSALVVVEVALALFLLIGAGLMIKGFQRYRATDLGFRPQGLLTARVDVKGKKYADPAVMTALGRRYLERLQALPGVKAAAIVGPAMPTDDWYGNSFIIEDRLTGTNDGVAFMVFHHVTPGYFAEMGIPLLEGRDFTTADTESTPLAIIISEGMKRKYWPNESPLGKRMRFGRRDPNAPWHTVVGVVGDLNQASMQSMEWPGPDVYFALLQFPPLLIPRFTFQIRPKDGVEPLALAQPLMAALKEVAPDLPPFDPDTMEHRLDKFTAKGRFLVLLMSLYAGIALVLAAAGLYGVLFYSVTQRTRELGIRVAVGAQDRDLVRLIVGRGALLVLLGLGMGLAAAFGLNRLFASLLYGVSATDALTFAGTSVLLFAVAMAATWHPALRAKRVPPTIALRME
jgi:putative ABC transport system permease protein